MKNLFQRELVILSECEESRFSSCQRSFVEFTQSRKTRSFAEFTPPAAGLRMMGSEGLI
jgi:hypothetical protein